MMRLRKTIGILFLTLIGLGLLDLAPAEVTHDDIRGAIHSLIYSYKQLDNKLERHEHRERALGEMLKKGLQALQNGQKNLEPINGIFTRLDERVSQIETMLITQEEKYNTQTEKLGEALEHMFKWMRENDECFKHPPGHPVATAVAAPAPAAIPPEFLKQQEQVNKELLTEIRKLSSSVEKLLDNSKNLMEQTQVTFNSIPSTKEMLTKIEDKLVSYSEATPAPLVEIDNSDFENKVFERFDELTTGIAQLRAVPLPKEGLSQKDKDFIHGLTNDTLNALQHVKLEALSATDKGLEQTAATIRQTEQNIVTNVDKVFNGVSSSADVLNKFYREVNGSYSRLNESLEVFQKFNNIIMTNSEYILDTQRKVEFSTLQIVQRISDILDKQGGEITALVKARFDVVDESIVSNQFEAQQNLSGILETELASVWRQIAIMNDVLTNIQGSNDIFVNGTYSGMEMMGRKVEEIKGRMLDMDSNLNFLLGKLSIMSQEFGNIKIGLAESLEELSKTFHNLQDKMPVQGEGPHTIDKNEYKTELNLLNKRQTTV